MNRPWLIALRILLSAAIVVYASTVLVYPQGVLCTPQYSNVSGHTMQDRVFLATSELGLYMILLVPAFLSFPKALLVINRSWWSTAIKGAGLAGGVLLAAVMYLRGLKAEGIVDEWIRFHFFIIHLWRSQIVLLLVLLLDRAICLRSGGGTNPMTVVTVGPDPGEATTGDRLR